MKWELTSEVNGAVPAAGDDRGDHRRKAPVLRSIYIDPAITRNLELLRRSGKKAALAAAKTEEIIARLKSGGEMPDQAGNVTKHGEQRIRGVMKFDLGAGYRLVTYRQKFRIFLLVVGTHDDCHRWIENNRELAVDRIKKRCTRLTVESVATNPYATGNTEPAMTEEDRHNPLSSLTQRDLRCIFHGLADGTVF